MHLPRMPTLAENCWILSLFGCIISMMVFVCAKPCLMLDLKAHWASNKTKCDIPKRAKMKKQL